MLPDEDMKYNKFYKQHKQKETTRKQRLAVAILVTAATFYCFDINLFPSRRPYTLRKLPAPFGYQVLGLDILQDIPQSVIESLRKDIFRHRLLLFRKTGLSSNPVRLYHISAQFGEVAPYFSRSFGSGLHPKIFRSINNRTDGHDKVGQSNAKLIKSTQAWHTDAYGNLEPPVFSFYHMANASTLSSTCFLELDKFLECVPRETAKFWSHISVEYNDSMSRPLVWQHPVTKKLTMRFGQQVGVPYIIDAGLPTEQQEPSFKKHATDLEEKIHKECTELVHCHLWKDDDLLMSDNWANAHAAGHGAALPAEEVGLRDLRRTIIYGNYYPEKPYFIE